MALCVGVQIRWRRERLGLLFFGGAKVVNSVVRRRKEKSFDRGVDGIVGSVSLICLDVSSDGKNLDLDCFRQKFDSHVLHFISSAHQISTSLVVDTVAEWLVLASQMGPQVGGVELEMKSGS